MSRDSLREHLTAFGLSTKETEAYLAILQSGTATTSDVSRRAEISQAYVYELAAELADRGLISIDETRSPTLLHARSPEDALGGFSDRLTQMRHDIESLYQHSDTDDPAVEIVHSRVTTRKRIIRAIDHARQEVVLTVPGSEFTHLQDPLREARERGVTIYLQLVEPVEKIPTGTDWQEYATIVKSWEATPPVTVVADEQTGAMGAHSILSGRHNSAYALVFSQQDIAGAFFGNAISNFWPMGDNQFTADPDPLPATYTHARTAVTNAALHFIQERSLTADVTVQAIGSEDTITYEGVPVVEIHQNIVGDPTNEFPIENNLVFDTPDGRIATGGSNGSLQPFYEGYGLVSITLYENTAQ
ncbi:TrmB family transcriptional regulator [Haloprofundus halobius]|uniref:TrmB family transcriptional regulator n=1 Tax=Haloprofundus halobius TaxID=2876194 RepID=UPI001CC9A873|nr:TrmB family transcriptional regulator sugar-binding domain-containing protein [Haloprofundus halobius]